MKVFGIKINYFSSIMQFYYDLKTRTERTK